MNPVDPHYGPVLAVSDAKHAEKYRAPGENFPEAMARIANALKDSEEHFYDTLDILNNMRFMPAGRIQAAMGAPRQVTPYNCFVSMTLPDSMDGIMKAAAEAAETMRLGGGIGYDFSTLRPRGDRIASLDSRSSGPLSFMQIFDAICKTIASAGHRRGAQMGVMRIDHPDIEEFIQAKTNNTNLTQFNLSVAVTDEFMTCLMHNKPFQLKWGGKVYRTVNSLYLWEKIMRATWDWAEPGVLFIDRANKMNNLWYCETFAATNPCAEQWLPPHGACLLGSFNLVKYLYKHISGSWMFDWKKFKADIPVVIRAMDNVVDRAIYPLEQQYHEAKNKRRMGIGVTGVANAIEAMGYPYGTENFLSILDNILKVLTNECYRASALLAKEKGSFPLYNPLAYLSGEFIQLLDSDVIDTIRNNGIRNSHLTSIAPTGTISFCADNVSSGIEPVYALESERIVQTFDGPTKVDLMDYGWRNFGVRGKTADEVSVQEHLAVLLVSQRWIDSSISKTCNVGDAVTFDQFKDIYLSAWAGGAKGCTTFRINGERFGILTKKATPEAPTVQEDGTQACYFDPETGLKSCE